MKFRTEIQIKPSFDTLGYSNSILTVGSCFSDVLGNFLLENKFDCTVNPLGTVYNLQSILQLIRYALQEQELNEELWVERDGVWYHHDFHSDFKALTNSDLKVQLEEALHHFKIAFLKSEWLVITLGTSWVYDKDERVVSNCHKVDGKHFHKRLLSYEQQLGLLEELQGYLSKNQKVILTVSPVRHIKDGMEENSLSKSILRLIGYQATQMSASFRYFPSYEILMDDLRDYRFYGSDLIHPNEMAEKYILDAFSKTYFTKEMQGVVEQWSKIRMALNHRPFSKESRSHQAFLVNLLNKINAFKSYFDVSTEIEWVKGQMERTSN